VKRAGKPTQTVWILGDQLSPEHAALAATNPGESRVLMVESKARGSALRYHQLKLVLIYSAMRHFAAELRAQGWEVDYQLIEGTGTFEDGLGRHVEKHRPQRIILAEPNSFPETDAVQKLARKLRLELEIVPTKQFLLPRDDFRAWASGQKRLLMENHYRRMRKRFGWLMDEDGEPTGGVWNLDRENRATHATWRRAGAPHPTTRLREEPDAITREVIEMVAREFPDHPGRAADFWLPVDRAGALRWLRSFIDERLPSFGAYEDMMATGEPHLFHSVLSPLLNIGLLTPRECVEAAIHAYRRGAAP
jgi:deoxyribodipyrimidine photolyase-related protein